MLPAARRTGSAPDTLPGGLAEVVARSVARLEPEFAAGDVVRRCFASAWTTTLRGRPDEPFVSTGDIPAMWHRDTVGQLRPYLSGVADPHVLRVLGGVVRRMAGALLADPYAKAINDGHTGAHAD